MLKSLQLIKRRKKNYNQPQFNIAHNNILNKFINHCQKNFINNIAFFFKELNIFKYFMEKKKRASLDARQIRNTYA